MTDNKLTPTQFANIRFTECYRRTLLRRNDSELYSHLDDLLEPICDFTGAFSAFIRLIDKTTRKMHIIAVHTDTQFSSLEKFGERKLGLFIAEVKEHLDHHEFYDAEDLQNIHTFKGDLNSVRIKLSNPETASDYYLNVKLYMESLGSSLICKLKLHDENFTGMLFVNKIIGARFTDDEKQFIKDCAPFLEAIIITIKRAEQEHAVKLLRAEMNSAHAMMSSDMFAAVFRACKNLTDCRVALLRIYDPFTQKVRLRFYKNFGDSIPTITKESPQFGASYLAISKKHAVLIADTDSNWNFCSTIRNIEKDLKGQDNAKLVADLEYLKWIKSSIAVPIRHVVGYNQNGIAAVLSVISETPHKFGPVDLFHMRALGSEVEHILATVNAASVIREFTLFTTHHIKNLSTAIYGSLSLHKEDLQNAKTLYGFLPDLEQVDVTSQISKSLESHTERLMRLFGDANLPIEKANLSLGNLINNALLDKRISHLKPDLHIDLNIPELTMHNQDLQTVFEELFLNMVDAGATSFTIKALYDMGKQQIVINISDNSDKYININDAHLLFQKKFTTKHRGTGIGLLGVKNVILLHGGHIELVREDPDEIVQALPAKFKIILPIKDVE